MNWRREPHETVVGRGRRRIAAQHWQISDSKNKSLTLGNADGETTVGATRVC